MPRYKKTGAKAEELVYQCAVRLLRGESIEAVHSSLEARGIGNADVIMERAFVVAQRDRNGP